MIKNYSPVPFTLYSNVACGKRKKAEEDELIPSILESEGSSREFRKNWARLIQKIYEVDPLTCPKCSGVMKVISVIQYCIALSVFIIAVLIICHFLSVEYHYYIVGWVFIDMQRPTPYTSFLKKGILINSTITGLGIFFKIVTNQYYARKTPAC